MLSDVGKMKRRSVKKKSRVRNRDCAWHVITTLITTWSRSAHISQIERVYSTVTLDAERRNIHKAEPGSVAKA